MPTGQCVWSTTAGCNLESTGQLTHHNNYTNQRSTVRIPKILHLNGAIFYSEKQVLAWYDLLG